MPIPLVNEVNATLHQSLPLSDCVISLYTKDHDRVPVLQATQKIISTIIYY